ncbi:MAG: hypothetical protein HOH13_02570 [Crocinitomicaceae bacterium]|jgi:hypothetical protein|nr:hypothetical protein [Crocinitomicaceae bacterium]MBT6029163.1 hypothetical protein [Crocinitomicaceae bacterium]MBT6514348.1 hypothetical protein [Crocinitomicaceae bacterium]
MKPLITKVTGTSTFLAYSYSQLKIIFILILLATVAPYFSYGQSVDSIPGLALRESKIEIRKNTPAKNARLLRKLMANKEKSEVQVLEAKLLTIWLQTATFGDEGSEIPPYMKPTKIGKFDVNKYDEDIKHYFAWVFGIKEGDRLFSRFTREIAYRGIEGCKKEIIQLYLWREHYRLTSRVDHERGIQLEIYMHEKYLMLPNR